MVPWDSSLVTIKLYTVYVWFTFFQAPLTTSNVQESDGCTAWDWSLIFSVIPLEKRVRIAGWPPRIGCWVISFSRFFLGKNNIIVIPSHMKKIYLGIISHRKILGIMSSGFQWFMCGVWLIFVSKIASPGCSTMPDSGQSVIKPRARDMVPMKYVVRVNGDPKIAWALWNFSSRNIFV